MSQEAKLDENDRASQGEPKDKVGSGSLHQSRDPEVREVQTRELYRSVVDARSERNAFSLNPLEKGIPSDQV